jgi:pyruvate-ferredoxin/flavodoxin oxidoreductase
MKKMKTMDGNEAAAHISYAFTDVAAIYPITPSSNMAEHVDEWAAQGRKNLFGQAVKVVEMQSEGGAAGAVHGSLQVGALTTTYTASQGLLLMIPAMYKIAGELLPGVFHVSARVLDTNGICIFGDHSDVMATRQTGFALLAESSVQQVMDLSAVAHLAALKGRVPFLSFFDGFRTSHEVQKIEQIEYEQLRQLLDWDAIADFRRRGLNPDKPVVRGTTQNSDILFQQREVVNPFYNALPDIVESYMGQISQLTGREYHLFNYYGAADAERIIIAMGSVCETVEETVDYLMAQGEKVGLLTVHLYRPFSVNHFLNSIPPSVKKIAVLDRTKELGAFAEPLYLDVKAVFYGQERQPVIVGGRCGIGGKEIVPGDIHAVFENLKITQPKDHFTLGINDDVTFASLTASPAIETTNPGSVIACKFWGLGADGTVGANKNTIAIIGAHTDLYAQAYFAYDSKKSGGITISHLRFGKQPIKSPYLITRADLVACHNPSYVNKYNLLDGLKAGGKFLLNCSWNAQELETNLPAAMKRYLWENQINVFTIDAVAIARELGLGARINIIMQAAFFKISDIIPVADAIEYMKQAVIKSYAVKGESIVAMNHAAIEKGASALCKIDLPAIWATACDDAADIPKTPAFIREILEPVNRQEGDKLPVSTFVGMEDGSYPVGTSIYEKRGIAIDVPCWQAEHCIQCNQCSYVCPHAAIRPVLVTATEQAAAPAGFITMSATGVANLQFRIAISPYDCTGCGNCQQVCPTKQKALVMQPLDSQLGQAKLWNYAVQLPVKANPLNPFTLKGSQFEQPLLEFSGACAGCGETPYAKLITQLYGERMMIANSTGCSSVWAGSVPSMPYTINQQGHGPAWGHALFENTAEFGLGMLVGVNQVREKLAHEVEAAMHLNLSTNLKWALADWLTNKDVSDGTRQRADKLVSLLASEKAEFPLLREIYRQKEFLVKRSHWIFGGDGWAYDIGFGGLDHILASGENINVLVFDTEVYSNTGGQSSKSTPTAAIAKFAASGKKTKKKDLGMIALSYGSVYVAQIAMGADRNQTLKAIAEAEAYPGVSIIIAYAPCINHGIKAGMGSSQLEAKRAVDCGYWALYRYNPILAAGGKSGFVMDSKPPTMKFEDFLLGEVRYAALKKQFPEDAEALFAKTEQDAMERLANYRRLAAQK